MASMMSPATKHLLADMNRSTKNANSNGPSSKPIAAAANGASRRQPLGAIQETKNRGNIQKPTDAMKAITEINCKNNNNKTTPIKSNRTIGPNEMNYAQNYEAYITETILKYESKLQSNIGKQNSSSALPCYKRMNKQQRSDALNSVNKLLERLVIQDERRGEAASKPSSSISSNDETLFDTQFTSNNNMKSTGGGMNDESFGSATTMGGHDGNNNSHNATMNKSIGSETTMMEQSMSLLGSTTNNTTINTRNSTMDGSTTMEQSMSLFDGDGSRMSRQPRTSLESDATTEYNQSMSLLGNESHLFSPGAASIGGGDNYKEEDDDESRFSRGGDLAAAAAAADPIEKVRRYQSNYPNNDDRMMTSPQFTSSYNHKRCASNSGKRGMKSRLRYEAYLDGKGDFTVDDSLLQQFDHGSNDGNDDGILFPSQVDDFSPIQHRFSHDGLQLNCGIDRYDGSDDDASASRDRFYHDFNYKTTSTEDGDEDDNISFGCNDDGFDNDEDYDEFGTHHKWTQPSQPLTQQQKELQSQWSTFKTVDPSTQTNEEDSPVKRRAIRFESTQKGNSRQMWRQHEQNDCVDEDEEKIQSLRDQLTETHVNAHVGEQDEDPIQTVGNLCRRARSYNEEGMDTSLLDEVAPIDVRLRDGHLFHKDPLQCRQVPKKKGSSKSKSSKTVRIAKGSNYDRHAASDSEDSLSDPDLSFKDPTSSFPSRVAERLNGAFDFMMTNKSGDTTSEVKLANDLGDENAGVLLSLDLKQTMAVTSKLLLTTKKLARSHRISKNKKVASTPSFVSSTKKGVDYFAGGNLIILRAKDDIPLWEAALREYTSLSVFSHNSLQAKERKDPSTAAKYAVYDVVLTTYDLLKSKDATIPVDSNGKAILSSDSIADDGGWLKTRGSETQIGVEPKKKVLGLSILHRMSWYRVVMVDSLGRKGYLKKPNTIRAEAARALNSLARFIFFLKEDEDYKMVSKFKNDRNQIKSVVQALHLPQGTTSKTFLGKWAHDVKSSIRETNLDSSSCDDDRSVSSADEYNH